MRAPPLLALVLLLTGAALATPPQAPLRLELDAPGVALRPDAPFYATLRVCGASPMEARGEVRVEGGRVEPASWGPLRVAGAACAEVPLRIEPGAGRAVLARASGTLDAGGGVDAAGTWRLPAGPEAYGGAFVLVLPFVALLALGGIFLFTRA